MTEVTRGSLGSLLSPEHTVMYISDVHTPLQEGDRASGAQTLPNFDGWWRRGGEKRDQDEEPYVDVHNDRVCLALSH